MVWCGRDTNHEARAGYINAGKVAWLFHFKPPVIRLVGVDALEYSTVVVTCSMLLIFLKRAWIKLLSSFCHNRDWVFIRKKVLSLELDIDLFNLGSSFGASFIVPNIIFFLMTKV